MAKLTSMHIFALFLLLAGIFMTSEVVAEPKRCQIVLNPSGCDLPTCRKECYTKYQGNGECISGEPKFYKCICVYNC
ncbi:hypothetical protein Lal_00019676 [Lupinus albus]|uniref:Uncharacterized protein n=1 Tax=Lupinus albus TaxID=3870 RepID=A0A6A4R406_LUPAL|nr:hypothetical protein Lalb_Chr01g0006151 [Lupinus albus]KAF1899520.1 hypothetical protein Lal_00019648 [Lupinus albus]KAF1899548.1 hypothetical protein Lal_00019676 [Lupinus albus]